MAQFTGIGKGCNMTYNQETAIRCALLDLIGAFQAYSQSDIHVHDWRAHLQTIQELKEAFSCLNDIDVSLDDEVDE